MGSVAEEDEEGADDDDPDKEHGQQMEEVLELLVVFQVGRVINSDHAMVLVAVQGAQVHEDEREHVAELLVGVLVEEQQLFGISQFGLGVIFTLCFYCLPILVKDKGVFLVVVVYIDSNQYAEIYENHD